MIEYNYWSDVIMHEGEYKGNTVREVYLENPAYLDRLQLEGHATFEKRMKTDIEAAALAQLLNNIEKTFAKKQEDTREFIVVSPKNAEAIQKWFNESDNGQKK
jgi:hypothetical protein